MTQRTPIQMIAQLRSDLLDRSHALDLRKPTLTDIGGCLVTAEYADRQQSEDAAKLLDVVLTQPVHCMADVLSLSIAIAELASQAFVVDDKRVSAAGARLELAAETMVAFLAGKVRPQNNMDRAEVKRCRRLVGVRHPEPVEA